MKKIGNVPDVFLIDMYLGKVAPIIDIDTQYNKNRKRQKKTCPHLEAFLDFYALVLLVPFQLNKDVASNQYVLTSGKIRKTLVIIIHVLNITIGSILLYNTMDQFVNIRRDITTAFYAISHITTISSTALLLKVFHWEQAKMLQFMNNCSAQLEVSDERKARATVFAICLVTSLTSIIHQCLTTAGAVGLNNIYQTKWIFSPILQLPGFNLLDSLINLVSNTIWYNIGSAIICYHFVLLNLQLALLLTISLGMDKVVGNDFTTQVATHQEDILTVLSQHRKLQKSAGIVMSLFGNLILSYYICALSFLAELPQIVLTPSDGSDGVIKFCFYVYMGLISAAMYQSTKFNDKVDKSIRHFIAYHHSQLDLHCEHRLMLIALTQEIDAQPIGISCSFFTITKNFLCSTISLVITYSLIVFQMSDKEKVFWTT